MYQIGKARLIAFFAIGLILCAGIYGVIASTLMVDPTPIDKGGIDALFTFNTDIRKFETEQEYREYIQKIADYRNNMFGGGFSRDDVVLEDGATGSPVPSLNGNDGKGSEGQGSGTVTDTDSSYSTTNVQVEGIDEPDLVKTDGKNIFIGYEQLYWYRYDSFDGAEGRAVPPLDSAQSDIALPSDRGFAPPQERVFAKIISAQPPQNAALISEITDFGGYSADLLLHQNNLMMISATSVAGYDVTNREKPGQKWEVRFGDHATYTTARLLDGVLYLITTTSNGGTTECPIRILEGSSGLIPCTDIYYPGYPLSRPSLYNIMKIDPSNGEILDTTNFMGESNYTTIYMSPTDIFVAYRENLDYISFLKTFIDENRSLFPNDVRNDIARVLALDISDSSKMNEFKLIYNRYQQSLTPAQRDDLDDRSYKASQDFIKKHQRDLSSTAIVSIDAESLNVRATASVPGYLLNQFSMDQHNGDLRVATTIESNIWGLGFAAGSDVKSENDLYILDKNMKVRSSVKGMGLDERVFGVRFVGDLGYIVTFKQTDPLYVLDLSNPDSPRITAELKIPGYSAYLHPLNDTLLLGVGRENNGVKLSLFDVSDSTNPIELDKKIYSYEWTEVENNHRAFLADPENNLFFLPGGGKLRVISYADGKLTELKAVSGSDFKRSIYIGQYLYAISTDRIIILDRNEWKVVKEVDLGVN